MVGLQCKCTNSNMSGRSEVFCVSFLSQAENVLHSVLSTASCPSSPYFSIIPFCCWSNKINRAVDIPYEMHTLFSTEHTAFIISVEVFAED